LETVAECKRSSCIACGAAPADEVPSHELEKLWAREDVDTGLGLCSECREYSGTWDQGVRDAKLFKAAQMDGSDQDLAKKLVTKKLPLNFVTKPSRFKHRWKPTIKCKPGRIVSHIITGV